MSEVSYSNQKVLIVDDEPDLCEMVSFEFALRGYRALSALDGLRALELLNAEPFSVVISDLRMPNLDGFELLDTLKASDACVPIVVFMSAYTEVSLQEAYGRGAEAFFPKPFRLADLANTVQRLNVPSAQRWAKPPDKAPIHWIKRHCAGWTDARDGRRFGVGRGGIAISIEDTLTFAGQQVGFDITFEQAPVSRLSGTGIVRWTESAISETQPAVCGIEFEYLIEETRKPFTAWVEKNRPKPYIPPYQCYK